MANTTDQTVPAPTLQPESSPKDPRSFLRIREEEEYKTPAYIAALCASIPEDDKRVKEISEFIKQRCEDFDRNVIIVRDLNHSVESWAGIRPLSDTALEEIEDHQDISNVIKCARAKKRLVTPKVNREVTTLEQYTGLSKRAPGPSGWYKQELAPSFNLKVISQYR
jgi:hypothetical protein